MTDTNLIMAWGVGLIQKKKKKEDCAVLHNLYCHYMRPNATTGEQIWLQELLVAQWHGESLVVIHFLAQIHPSLLHKPTKSPDSSHVLQAFSLPFSRCTVDLIKSRGSAVEIWGRAVHRPVQLMLLEYNSRHLAAAGGNKATWLNMGGNGGRVPESPLALLTLSKHFDTATCHRYLPSANLLKAIF